MSDSGYAADWPAPAGIRTWQTTRTGGVSVGSYSSLNIAAHVGDEAEAVTANRERLRAALDLPADPVWLTQVHGTRILHPDRGETGGADGAVTSRTETVLVVMTADCLPVFLATTDGDRIAVAHAGWRGLAHGVLRAAVAAVGRNPSDVMAWLGPAIGPGAFEVGDEVRSAFVNRDPETADAFFPNSRGRWQADLYALARRSLIRAGVRHIFGNEACTYSDAERWFSHRREAPCGRMASLIWRES